MVSLIISIDDQLNKKVKEYMLNNNISNKCIAVENILKETLK